MIINSNFSIQARRDEEKEFGDKVNMNKTALETIKMFHNQQEMDDFLVSSQALFWKEKGYEFKPLTVEECQELEPVLADGEARHGVIDNDGLVGGVLCGRGLDSSGDVYQYTCNIANIARDHGVNIRCGARVADISTSGDGGHVTHVELEDGEVVTGDVFVLAAGARSGHLARPLGVNLPVYPLRGYLVTVRPRPGVPMVTRNIYSPRHGLISPLHPDLIRLSGGVEVRTNIFLK